MGSITEKRWSGGASLRAMQRLLMTPNKLLPTESSMKKRESPVPELNRLPKNVGRLFTIGNTRTNHQSKFFSGWQSWRTRYPQALKMLRFRTLNGSLTINYLTV